MAVGDPYSLKMSGNLLNQTLITQCHYMNATGIGGAEELGTTFISTVIPFITPVVVDEVTFTDIEVINLNDASDFYVETFSIKGERTGECMGPFDAWGFKKNVARPDRKPGGYRFGGVEVGAVVNGTANGFYAPRLASLANVLSNNMISGGAAFVLVVQSTRCIKGTDGKCTGSFYPTDYVVVNNVTYDGFTTQNTRKFGVGV